eukprot:6402200-Pyramimonas_sp.AAC.1
MPRVRFRQDCEESQWEETSVGHRVARDARGAVELWRPRAHGPHRDGARQRRSQGCALRAQHHR